VLDLEPWQVDLRQPWADGDAPFKPMPGRASLRLRARHRLQGIEAVNADLAGRTINVAGVLAAFGARIAGEGVLHGPLLMHNASPDYRNLWIGSNVHLGRGVILDLTANLQIQSEATVSMGVTILTHTSVGDRPLRDELPDQSLPTIVGRGAYVGANATILAGCDIGDRGIVAAGAVVTRPVPPGAKVGGVPAHELRAPDQ
jgi:acetyltransferase-like isoleucine patch superfamily enzyme